MQTGNIVVCPCNEKCSESANGGGNSSSGNSWEIFSMYWAWPFAIMFLGLLFYGSIANLLDSLSRSIDKAKLIKYGDARLEKGEEKSTGKKGNTPELGI